jgi:hypothetical protein
MEQTYATFRQFATLEQANELVQTLNAAGIEALQPGNGQALDNSFGGGSLQNEYEVKLKPADFEKANQLLEDNVEAYLNQADTDYYLFSFSNDELYEILIHADEWNEFDFKLAQKILAQRRGQPVDEELVRKLKSDRLEALAKPEGGQGAWIIFGYVLALLGGFLGLIIGYCLWTFRKTLPNGETVPTYGASDRNHGRTIFFIGVGVFAGTILWRIFK